VSHGQQGKLRNVLAYHLLPGGHFPPLPQPHRLPGNWGKLLRGHVGDLEVTERLECRGWKRLSLEEEHPTVWTLPPLLAMPTLECLAEGKSASMQSELLEGGTECPRAAFLMRSYRMQEGRV
jgi:hypothetical protein